MGLTLAIHTSEWPLCAQATELIARTRGSAYRISSRRLLAAIANGRGILYDHTRKQVGLFRDRGVDNVVMFAAEEERGQNNPWRINGRPVFNAEELLGLAAEQIRTSFDIPVQTQMLAREQFETEPVSDVVFGCSDVRYFGDLLAFTKQRFNGRVHQYYWAGSITSSFVPFDMVEWGGQLKASNARNVHTFFHEDCAGHGGRHKLGEVHRQIAYYQAMLSDGSPLRRLVNREMPDQQFHFYFLQEGQEVMELDTWLPRTGA